MAHTFSILVHVIFSTKGRLPLIADNLKSDLLACMGGILRELKVFPMVLNGTDHVHMLLRLPAEVAPAECTRVLKTNSSRWVHEKWPERQAFGWQTGYAAFSVSESARPEVIRYIQNQEEHHRRVSFQEELIAYLKKNGVPYDERYMWD